MLLKTNVKYHVRKLDKIHTAFTARSLSSEKGTFPACQRSTDWGAVPFKTVKLLKQSLIKSTETHLITGKGKLVRVTTDFQSQRPKCCEAPWFSNYFFLGGRGVIVNGQALPCCHTKPYKSALFSERWRLAIFYCGALSCMFAMGLFSGDVFSFSASWSSLEEQLYPWLKPLLQDILNSECQEQRVNLHYAPVKWKSIFMAF